MSEGELEGEIMAAPFRLQDQTATLVIDNGPYTGVEVDVRLTTSWASLIATRDWLSSFQTMLDDVDGAFTVNETDRLLRTAADIFAGQLVGWNILDTAGVEVPPTTDGILALPASLMSQIIGMWVRSVGTVAPPLPNGSPAGVKRPTRRKTLPKS